MDKAVVGKGKYRCYTRHEYATLIKSYKKTGGLTVDFLGQLIFFLYCVLYYSSRLADVNDEEVILWRQVQDIGTGKFFISKGVPLLTQLISFATQKWSLDLHFWKIANNFVLSTSLITVFKILRESNVSLAVSLLASTALSQAPMFEDLISTFSMDSYHLMFLSLLILQWRNWQYCHDFSVDWYWRLSLLSVYLTLIMSGKFVGFISWMWLLIVCLKSVWTIIGDLEVSNHRIFLHICSRLLFLVAIPLSIVYHSYSSLLDNFHFPSSETSYMSSQFQHYVLGLHNNLPESLYYGSTITLRHVESLGGYLTSVDISYPDSEDGLVTLSDDYNDEANQWILEHHSNISMTLERPLQIKTNDLVKLRNKKTGRLLRASEEKPPISEKDYDKRVSTTGDPDYAGEDDEKWKIVVKSKTSFRGPINPFKHLFVLENRGRKCTLISHDIRMPKWGNGTQEVLCLDPPTESRALFYVDSTSKFNSATKKTYSWPERCSKTFLVLEYIRKQFKVDSYITNALIKSEHDNPLAWPFSFTSKNLVGSGIWVLSTLSIIVYCCIQLWSFLTWNIFDDSSFTGDASSWLKSDIRFESVLGWLLHIYVFNYSTHSNLSLNQYLPALLFAILNMCQFSFI